MNMPYTKEITNLESYIREVKTNFKQFDIPYDNSITLKSHLNYDDLPPVLKKAFIVHGGIIGKVSNFLYIRIKVWITKFDYKT